MFRSRPLGVRFFAPPAGPGGASYALTCDDRAYDLGRLSANTRSKTRRGLARCTVERLEPACVRAHGREVHEDTCSGIGVARSVSLGHLLESRRAVRRASRCGAPWSTAALVAYLVAGAGRSLLRDPGGPLASSPLLRFYPNNALLYTVVRDMFGRADIDRVFFGVESLEGSTGRHLQAQHGLRRRRPSASGSCCIPLLRPILRSDPGSCGP